MIVQPEEPQDILAPNHMERFPCGDTNTGYYRYSKEYDEESKPAVTKTLKGGYP